MSIQLEQINLGTAPLGRDGDTQRTANDKTNKNMTAIAAAVDGLAASVQANTTAIAGKADKSVTDALQAGAASFTGSVAMFARSTPPAGWLKANGALVSRTTYAALFGAIGTAFGAGDGATTFALPDLRGEFWRGWDDGRGADSGRAFGSAQAQNVQPHMHSLPGNILVGSMGSSGLNTGVAGGSAYSVVGQIADTGASWWTGSTGTTETRPRNIALLACIKY